MKNKISVLGSLFICSILVAQTKLLTMEDAMLGLRTNLATEKLKQLSGIKGAEEYSYVGVRNNSEALFKASAYDKQANYVVSIKALNDLFRAQKADTLKSFPLVDWENNEAFTFEAQKKLWRYNLKEGTLSVAASRDLKENAEHEDVSFDNKTVAYTVANNLFIFDGKNNIAVTNDANENIINGQVVHRDEFGITKGTFWSPKNNKLAFYRMDQTMVTDYPIIDWTTKPASAKNIKYPMAGGKSHEVTVGVYDLESKKTIFLETGLPADQYLTNVAWNPDGQHIYIAVLNRDQNHMKLNSYNALSGKFENTLFEEKDEKYVEPLHPMLFVKNNPKNFIWQSRRDGYNHLYLYDDAGKLIRQLTKGRWEVLEVLKFDVKGEALFYSATTESPLTSNLYSVNLVSGATLRLTQGDGMHAVTLNENGTMFIDQFSNTRTPLETATYSAAGKKISTLLNSKDPLAGYALGKMSLFTIKSNGGQDLYCRLYKPVNFDSTKKYPVIVYEYGGPHAQMILNNWVAGARDLWFQYMAERGFIVFTLDNRGSMNRGKDFEQATFRKLGTYEMEDQLTGVKWLKKKSYVDSTRMGLFGWSFGGFMTCSIMTKYPDVFKAAVAGGPVLDWSYYEIMYGERYMDTPETNPEGYKENNVINRVGDLKGKLLVIHGTADPVVVWQHSIMFLKAAVDKKKQVDYFVYPGYEHNVLGKDRVHLYQKVTDYFMQNL